MNLTTRNIETSRFFRACQTLLADKGAVYTGHEEVWESFRRIAAASQCSIERVLLVFLHKHIDAIRGILVGDTTPTDEGILHRCMDAANYLALIATYATVPEPTNDLAPAD